MPMIETQSLRKRFKKGKDMVEAVRGVDLLVEANQTFGFLGPNGAGKTTLLRMLVTLIAPDAGQAVVAGHDLLRAPNRVRASIGYVSQVGGVDSQATARENLVLQGQLYGMNKATAHARAVELIDAFELGAFADRAGNYSGGQKRRLDIAMGMVHRPALLFLDEPTTALDPQSRARLWDEVRQLRTSGTTVFLTTHYLDEADALCDRVAIMDAGRIVVEDTPDALKRQVAGDIVTIGLDAHNGDLRRAEQLLQAQPFVRELHNRAAELQLHVARGEDALPAILRLLDGEGLQIRALALARPTLNDVFLRQTGRSLRDDAA
jgi:ABC-2 type transport system ATP-binding protein